MKPTRSPKPPPTPEVLADREFNHRLRYSLFQSMCEILEVGSAPEDLARLRRQRAELEKKLGYETYRAEETRPSPCIDPLEESERRAFELQARRRIRAALKRKLKPGEKIRIPKFFRREKQGKTA